MNDTSDYTRSPRERESERQRSLAVNQVGLGPCVGSSPTAPTKKPGGAIGAPSSPNGGQLAFTQD